jgi:adenine-specific DNA-methyltransferase
MNFIEHQSEQKLRGGYYTPDDLAHFLVRWVREIAPKKILEPSCGDGVFFRAMARLPGAKKFAVQGFELDAVEAKKATTQAKDAHFADIQIDATDFLAWASRAIVAGDKSFDAVVGNPPFIRYQYLPSEFQPRAEAIFNLLDLPFTKHTNAWVPFVLASLALLRPGGRLAMVVPAEIIHVTHAQSLRTYLGKNCSRLVVIDPEELWFTNTLQGAVLLLAEKKRHPSEKSEGLGIHRVRGRAFVDLDPADLFNAPQPINGQTVEGKWTRALLDPKTRSLFDGLLGENEVHKFDQIAEVDVGIVTGANKYFLVTDDVVEQYGLSKWAHPAFGRSGHCPGVVYDDRQHEANARNGNPTNLILFRDSSVEKNSKVREYIELGEREKLHTRYKCRIRTPWYSVPSIYSTEIGMLKRAHDTPRLILNRIGAYTTDTAYRIRSDVPPEKLVYCFVNALTALSAELEGRHYGGGVLELIPSEIERLYIALPRKISASLSLLDRDVRTMPSRAVLEKQSKKVLGALGLSRSDQSRLLEGWQSLRDRRQRVSTGEGDSV